MGLRDEVYQAIEELEPVEDTRQLADHTGHSRSDVEEAVKALEEDDAIAGDEGTLADPPGRMTNIRTRWGSR